MQSVCLTLRVAQRVDRVQGTKFTGARGAHVFNGMRRLSRCVQLGAKLLFGYGFYCVFNFAVNQMIRGRITVPAS
jgi:hypothetical protein